MGTMPGVQAVTGLICDDPICNYQGAPSLNQPRDARIVASILSGVPVAQVAFAAEMSRQRIYQILNTWKQGI